MDDEGGETGKPKQTYQLRNTFMTVLENPSVGNKRPFYVRYPTLRNTEKMEIRMSRGPCDGLFYVPWTPTTVDDMVDRMAKPAFLYPENYVEHAENPPQPKTVGGVTGLKEGPLMNIVNHATSVLAKSMCYRDDKFCAVRNFSFNSCPEDSDMQNNPLQLLYNAGNYSLLVYFWTYSRRYFKN